MHLLQVPPPPAGSIDPFVGWLVALVLGLLTSALGKLYLDSRAESKRKDELIDRLLRAGLKNADTSERSVSLLEEEKWTRR